MEEVYCALEVDQCVAAVVGSEVFIVVFSSLFFFLQDQKALMRVVCSAVSTVYIRSIMRF